MAQKEKDKNTMIYLLLLLGGVGYVVYQNFKKKQAEKANVDGGKLTELDPWNASEYTEARGKSYVAPNLYINTTDAELKEYVMHLQQKLNKYIETMKATDFPYYPLKVDGLLGFRTALAVARVFGKGRVPITSKEQIKNLIENYQ